MSTTADGDRSPFEDLYDLAPCGFLSIDRIGTIRRANRTFARWIGAEPEELVDQLRFQDLLTVGGRIYHDTHFAPLLLMQDEVHEVALDLRCMDGTSIPVLVNAAVRRVASLERVLITVFDASDRRRYEQDLLATTRRAEAAEHRAEFVAGVLLAMDEEPTLAARAQRLVDLLVPTLAEAATIEAFRPEGDPVVRRAGTEAAFGDERVLALRRVGRAVGRIVLHGRPASDLAEDDQVMAQLRYVAALAIDNARLFEDEQAVALVLQRSLLSSDPPDDDRFVVASRYLPATATLEVGGDWYDAFCLDDGRLAVLVGDVVGHGIHAAAAMGQLRSAVRALAMGGDGPGEVLGQLDRYVTATGVGQIATIVFAQLDPESGSVAYACAGHPPPLLVDPDRGSHALMDGRSAPLGVVLNDQPRPEGTVHLELGQTLVLFTDGLFERRTETVDDGLARLRGAADALRSADPEALADGLLDALVEPTDVGDDVCLLALRRVPEPPAG